MPGPDLPYALGDARGRVLHRLRLVEHDRIVLVTEQRPVIARDQRIGGDDQIMVGDIVKTPQAAGTVQNEQPQVRAKRAASRRQLPIRLVETTRRLGRSVCSLRCR